MPYEPTRVGWRPGTNPVQVRTDRHKAARRFWTGYLARGRVGGLKDDGTVSSAAFPTVQAMHKLLIEVTGDIAQRSVDAWRPAFGSSLARREIAFIATLTCGDGVTLWGQAPLEVVWKASELLYVAVLEHARATAWLLVPPFRTWAPSAEVRVAVEAAAQVAWLLDPAVDGRARIGRYYILRLHMARQLEHTYNEVQPGGPLSDYGMPPADVEADAALLGLNPLPNKHGVVIGYEGQKIEQIKKLAALIVGDNGVYSVLSGSAHSEFWSLLGATEVRGHRRWVFPAPSTRQNRKALSR